MHKYTPEDKIEIVQGYLDGKFSLMEKARELGYSSTPGCFRRWIQIYQQHGPEGLYPTVGNRIYTKEFKKDVVEAYLRGDGSAFELAAKYKISAADILLKWVRLYNTNKELTDYVPKREVYMAESRRKTTLDERKEIVEYCLNHNCDYKSTAEIYEVSYSQVYSWVKKYNAMGEEGLTDRRGHRKSDEELDELERLKRENLRLKRQLEERDMLVELLKKVKEFERM